MKALRRRRRRYVLFLVSFLLCILVNTAVSGAQETFTDIEKSFISDLRNLPVKNDDIETKLSNLQLSVERLVQQGQGFYEAGKYAEAINLWQQALSQTSASQERAIIYSNLAVAFRQIGQIDKAIAHWEQAIQIYAKAGDPNSRTQQAKLIVEQAQAYSELGQHKRAIQLLQASLLIARHNRDRLTEAAAEAALGNSYWSLGDYEQAISSLQNSLKIARELKDGESGNKTIPNYRSALIQTALNNLGNVFAKRADRYLYQANVAQIEGDERENARLKNLAQQDIFAAKEALEESIQVGVSDTVTVQALLNLNRLLERHSTTFSNSTSVGSAGGNNFQGVKEPDAVNSEAIAQNRERAYELLQKIPDSREKSYALINLGVGSEPSAAAKIFADAIAVSKHIGDSRAESFALGSLAQLYEKAHQYTEAMELNRQALFAAQKINAVDSLYRWQWQAGRIEKATGKIPKAISYYEEAIASLQSIRSDILAANKDLQFDFRDSVEPVYRQMMGLLLQPSNSVSSFGGNTYTSSAENMAETQPKNLSKVIDILELLKLAELQNFFGDECVQVAKENAQNDGNLADTGAAIVYSVILDDRTEMIVRSPDGKLKNYTVAMGQEQLQQEIDRLRLLLENRATEEYLPQAQKIYDLLIRPMEKDGESKNLKTLVFINDGVLRKIPMAALHDGKQFLIQKYAIATTPSLSLTASKPADRRNFKALSVGLTVERPPFAPLANVATEVAEVQKILGGTKLLDKDFTLNRLETELRQNNFPIIHMATHGKFGVDAASTFLLGYDRRIGIDEIDNLLRFAGRNNASTTNKQPVELLTLSACQTAAGDNRAALGIAGVAVRAGVRSALASLWYINDEATVPLIEAFYTQLRQPNISKAEALRRAQMKLIASDDYSHPGVWSPLILIGNWL
ncbi:CHAT domain-containing protein [Planktothrix sp. FACHB-1355]|uniref:CHAT domain-containing protein n=1 Tax=Aerosakkonema funiforme FACHB-1375 TaxID=2949571 RepID=A0A926VCN2_9CYAN|nr:MULTISPECIES: CHAT domain-containing protein [Oscillatoriales]MBD2181411.1 CHAT domain-containing protein [Aerosakkonema funiforme FACHB-1375]MBD3560917.1 CHAT domain-containing protein [Planktothrix sp. FACHB-1355]